jgi:hypothetical protein
MWLDGVFRVRGSDNGEVVSSLSPKMRPWPHLASNFSWEVLSWIIDNSS